MARFASTQTVYRCVTRRQFITKRAIRICLVVAPAGVRTASLASLARSAYVTLNNLSVVSDKRTSASLNTNPRSERERGVSSPTLNVLPLSRSEEVAIVGAVLLDVVVKDRVVEKGEWGGVT